MTDPSRRALLAAGLVLSAPVLTPLAAPLRASAATPARLQAAGYQRFPVGEAVVTALLDGYIDLPAELWRNVTPEDLAEGLRGAFLPPDRPLRISVNAFVIETAGQTIAIDAGARDLFGPTAGRHAEVLAAAGFAPGAIDLVALTHLHPDHLGGLAAQGTARFPRAGLAMHEADRAYWTSEAARAAAPDFARPWFDAAAETLRAYGERVTPFRGEARVAPGLTAIPLHGHTPGHVGYLFESAGETLFFWADSFGQTALQLNAPERGLVFDIDPARATESRRKAAALAADRSVLVAGSHVPFPGFGHVGREAGRLRFHPAEWVHMT